MINTMSLPMYDVYRPDTQALWSALLPLLVEEGLAAERLSIVWPQEEQLSHWQKEEVLLSQTCGYPLVTFLTEVQLVGCFQYSAPGCENASYRSFLIAREEDANKTLADFRGRRVVCNSPDSQSGYNVLRSMIAPLAQEGAFFAGATFSGSHRNSLLALTGRSADIAAIDCITWALLARHEPHLLRGLAVIGQSPPAPGLPLITSSKTSPASLAALRRALERLVGDKAYRTQCEALFICGFSELAREDYSVIVQWQEQACDLGVTCL